MKHFCFRMATLKDWCTMTIIQVSTTKMASSISYNCKGPATQLIWSKFKRRLININDCLFVSMLTFPFFDVVINTLISFSGKSMVIWMLILKWTKSLPTERQYKVNLIFQNYYLAHFPVTLCQPTLLMNSCFQIHQKLLKLSTPKLLMVLLWSTSTSANSCRVEGIPVTLTH